MSAEGVKWAQDVLRFQPYAPPSVKRVIAVLGDKHTQSSGLAKITYKKMSEKTHDSRRATINAVAWLVGNGHLDKLQSRKGQRQGANEYYLVPLVLRDRFLQSQRRFSGCRNETPERGAELHPDNYPQGAETTPPTRARALYVINGCPQPMSCNADSGEACHA